MTMAISVVGVCVLLATMMPSPTNGYGGGAPNSTKVCSAMTPGHGTKQTSVTGGSSPYQLIVTDVDRQAQLNLVATAQVTFAGFIIQARRLEDRDKIVNGEFLESDEAQVRDCLDGKKNTLTHTSGDTKTQVTTIWLPPLGFNGAVVFRATVVQVKQAYFDQIYSKPVYFLKGQLVDEKSYQPQPQPGARPMGDQAPVSPAPSQSSLSSSGGVIDYDQCRQRVCFGLGDKGCLSSRNCLALLTAGKVDGDRIEYAIYGRPEKNDYRSKYWSVGLSDDKYMGDDFVVDCLSDSNGRGRIGYSHNKGRSNSPLNLAQSVASKMRAVYTNGLVVCQWEMPSKFSVSGKTYDLGNNRYHHLFVAGDLESDEGYKDVHKHKMASDEPINLAVVGEVVQTDTTYLVKVHGICMVIAWMGTVSVGIIFARYFKDAWQNSMWCGVKVWFACHRTLMVASLILMVIAQACIFIYVGGYHPGWHQVCGSIAFTLAVLQPIGALLRPHPDASSRWLFNWGHWLGGNAGHITAVATILLATRLTSAKLSDTFLLTVVAWILFHVVVHLILQFHSSCIRPRQTRDIALQDMVNHDPRIFMDKDSSGGSRGAGVLRCFLLVAYVVVALGLCTLLVLLIAYPGQYDLA